MIRLSLDYAHDLRAEHPAVVTRSVTCEHLVRRSSFHNSNGVVQQESRGIHGFSTLFAASDGARTTEFNSYGLNSLERHGRLIELGDQRRRYRNAELGIREERLDDMFVGSIIVAPEGAGFLVTPLIRDVMVKADWNSGTAITAGDRIASDALSLSNQPYGGTIALGRDFDDYGVPTGPLDVITAGRLANPLVDYVAAARTGAKQNYGWNSTRIHAGTCSLEDMIAGTGRGIIMSGFAGTTARDMQYSGVAKNCFYVVEGVIACAVGNVMISGDMRALLRSITHVSRETLNSGGAIFPYIAAGGVTIQVGTH